MNKKQLTYSILALFLIGLIVAGGAFGFYSWVNPYNKNIIFNTAKNLEKYIVYDEGDSKFIGDFKVSSTYTEGMHSTISLYKTSEAANVNLLATINMDVNSIGNYMKQSRALKWVVTSGTSTNVGSVLAQGNFIGVNNGDTLTLVPNIEVTTTKTYYTVWLWIDSSLNPSDNLTGETLDTTVWTEISQVEGVEDKFEITRINANYQNINATVVNNKHKITSYAVTTSNTTPSSWTSISSSEQSNVYNLNHTVSEIGTYYVWFKSDDNKTVSRSVVVTSVDTTAPECTWGTFNPTTIGNNATSTIELTCIDNESEITINNLKVDNIITSNSNISVMSIVRVTQSNGYKYTINVKGTANDGETTLTLPANSIKNVAGLGNDVKTSDPITLFSITPTISLTAKSEEERTYTGSPIPANTATVSPNGGGTITYTYYTNNACSDGATTTVPTYGTWYVKASIAASGNYNAASSDCVNHTIIAATPTVSLSAKTGMTYNGSAQVANTATVSPNGGGTITYTYYTDNACSTGATTTAPTNAGDYYAKASVAEVPEKTNAATSSCVIHTIAKKDLTATQITAYEATWVSGATTYSRSGVATGVGSETVTLTYTPYANSVGSYTYATSAGSGKFTLSQTNTNYSISGAGNFTITDSSAPTVSDITGGTTLKATSQSLTLKCTDNVGVTAYYFGTTNPTEASAITTTTSADLTSLQGSGLTKSVTAAGTYYFACKDSTGNFNKKSIVIRKYQVQNVLEKIAGTTGTYTSANYETNGSAATYYIKDGTTLTLTSIYSIPTGAASGTFKGYTTSAPGTNAASPSTTNPTVATNDTTVYYMWFNRSTFSVTISKPTNGTVKAETVAQTGNSKTASTTAQTLTVKYGDTVKATATANTGYTFTSWSGGYVSGSTNPVTGAAVTAAKTITVTFADITPPTGSVSATLNDNIITASITVNDNGSGPKASYGWKVSTSNTCNSSTTGFVDNTNNTYNYSLSTSGTYYTCVRIEDNAGNKNYVISSAQAYIPRAYLRYLGAENSFFKESTYKDAITSVQFVNQVNTSGAVKTYDLSENTDNKIIGWLKSNGSMYDLYIGSNQTIYAKNLQNTFRNLQNLSNINLNNLNTSLVTDMSGMFSQTGRNSNNVVLNFGSSFDTSNVTNMAIMFDRFSLSTSTFNLNLGTNFNTSKVTNMSGMFEFLGYYSSNFNLNLGTSFNTSNVTNMSNMFYTASALATQVNLNLGTNFNTSKVTDMSGMFSYYGFSTPNLNTNFFGTKFDTRNVTNMANMFFGLGYNTTSFNMNLGQLFNTSNVINISGMFCGTCQESTNCSLNLGTSFNTIRVTDMSNMFASAAQNSTNLVINLGSNFNTSNVMNMSHMFDKFGSATSNYNLNLGLNFNTSKVTNMSNMFDFNGWSTNNFSLNLGTKFNTSNVTNMAYMFKSLGAQATTFNFNLGSQFYTNKVIDMSHMFDEYAYSTNIYNLYLGSNFNTSNVTNMANMFCKNGRNSTNFNLNLGNHFDMTNVTNAAYFLFETGYNTYYIFNLDFSPGNFSKIVDYTNMFTSLAKSSKIYVKDATARTWLTSRNSYWGTSFSASNVLIK